MDNRQGKNYAVVDLAANLNEYLADGQITSGGNVIVQIKEVEVPVSQVSLRYGLNAIPEATIVVALGKDVKTNELSNSYAIAKDIKQMVPIKISIRGSLGDWSTFGNEQWPDATEPVVIFMGYVSGMTYRRTSGRISLVINAVNQLIDLALSSGGSKDVVPNSPADLLLPTLVASAGSTNQSAAGTADTKFYLDLNASVITDFSKAILTCLYNVSLNNRLQLNNKLVWCPGTINQKKSEEEENKKASRAIKGFGDWLGIANYSADKIKEKYTRLYPLALDSFPKDAACRSISRQISNSLASTSMWGMLVGSICAEFSCGIIPMARSAIFAPILPMAKKHQITLFSEDYVDFNFSCMSQTPLYGFAIISNYTFFTFSGKTGSSQCVGASYIANVEGASEIDGMYMFGQAPDWLDSWTNFDPVANKNPAVVSMTSGTSNTGVGGSPNPSVNRDLNQESTQYSNALNKYAKMMYATNALRSREGVIVGKLRFDIAPGTTIKISSGSRDKSASGLDSLAEPLIGFVAKVTITIDSEQAAASTSFELTNLRTETENSEDRFSMETHPFFSNYFEYAPIVPELSLPPVKD